MKKIFISLGLILLTISSYSQINLEHTFTAGSTLTSYNTNSKGIMFYYITDTISNQIKIYNQDYSLYKTITIPRPAGYIMSITLLSEQLFNSNSSLEFICGFYKFNSAGYVSKIKIYDENLTVLKDFGSYNYYAYPYVISKGSLNKLILYSLLPNSSSQYISEIFSLPGSIPNNVSELNLPNVKPAYPNPAKTIIALPYILEKEQTSLIRIYKLNGQLIEQKLIDSTFDKLLLNVESYQSGVYLYEYNGISNKFIVN